MLRPFCSSRAHCHVKSVSGLDFLQQHEHSWRELIACQRVPYSFVGHFFRCSFPQCCFLHLVDWPWVTSASCRRLLHHLMNGPFAYLRYLSAFVGFFPGIFLSGVNSAAYFTVDLSFIVIRHNPCWKLTWCHDDTFSFAFFIMFGSCCPFFIRLSFGGLRFIQSQIFPKHCNAQKVAVKKLICSRPSIKPTREGNHRKQNGQHWLDTMFDSCTRRQHSVAFGEGLSQIFRFAQANERVTAWYQ